MVGVDLGAVEVWLSTIVVVLGLALSGLAYLGYRRNENQAMLLLAIGMLFVSVGPTFFQEVVSAIIIRDQLLPFIWVNILARSSEAIGLVILLYSIHTQRTR